MSATPEFDGLMEKYEAEEREALIAYSVRDIVAGAESLLRQASES